MRVSVGFLRLLCLGGGGDEDVKGVLRNIFWH